MSSLDKLYVDRAVAEAEQSLQAYNDAQYEADEEEIVISDLMAAQVQATLAVVAQLERSYEIQKRTYAQINRLRDDLLAAQERR